MAMEKVEITGLFPRRLRQILESISLDFDQLEEVRLRCGQPVLLRVNGREMGIIGNDQLVELAEQLWKKEDWKKLENINEKELKDTLEIMGGFSLYAAEEELQPGLFYCPGRSQDRCCRESDLKGAEDHGDQVSGIFKSAGGP